MMKMMLKLLITQLRLRLHAEKVLFRQMLANVWQVFSDYLKRRGSESQKIKRYNRHLRDMRFELYKQKKREQQQALQTIEQKYGDTL